MATVGQVGLLAQTMGPLAGQLHSVHIVVQLAAEGDRGVRPSQQLAAGLRLGARAVWLSGGDINIPGSAGLGGGSVPNGMASLGYGAASVLAGTARPVSSGDQPAGSNFGGGGPGVSSWQNNSARAGGNGAPGIVIIEEYE